MAAERYAVTRWLEPGSKEARTEMTLDAFQFETEALHRRSLDSIACYASWTSQTEWMTWMKMGGSTGHMLWRLNNAQFARVDDLPADFRSEAAKHFGDEVFQL